LEYPRIGGTIGAERDWDRTVKDKLKLLFLMLALVAAGVLASVVYRFSHEELMVDQCLSGSHGSFDYSSMNCDLETNHPYVPYQVRHPRDKQTASVALVSFAVFVSACFYRRNQAQKEVISSQSTAKS
jgi:hypothetical protein